MNPSANANIARHLTGMATEQPHTAALKIPRGRTASGDIDYLVLDFQALAAEANAWTEWLAARGVRRGDRTLVMVRPGLPLIASVFALFQLGAVPVIIDPGMGLKNFLACVARSRPRALVGIPTARLIRQLFRRTFRTVEVIIAASSSLTARLASAPTSNFQLSTATAADSTVSSGANELAAVLFTSGSTGAPKGVCYEHGMFEAQVQSIRKAYGIQPGEVDLPLLPIFALFNPALGMTSVIPEIDPRRPAAVDPAKIVQAIRQEQVTNSFGSPTLWTKIGAHCQSHGMGLPSLRRVLCAGAPVPAALWKSSAAWLPNGELHSPYGATEALPVATISAAEMLPLLRGPIPDAAPPAYNVMRDEPGGARPQGTCLGRPLPGMEVRIVAISDGPIPVLAEARELPPGEIGEIVVRGPVVTKTYDALPEATRLAKIFAASDKFQVTRDKSPTASDRSLGASPLELGTSGANSAPVWHRMGDCGQLDAAGRLWFCGRKAERVETDAGPMFTEPCEQVFRRHAQVGRCALVGLGERGRQEPALVVESAVAGPAAAALARELGTLAVSDPRTSAIKRFYFHPRFPVDVRHNAKIHRLALARWAAAANGHGG